ncbi:uridine kinase family protein [Streptomyces sp. BI20]|uniref:uridine kinase family protein n=1 Tax=Streptomyces sp. BI20 TaxID=3403460 RepID=UPI003C729CC5
MYDIESLSEAVLRRGTPPGRVPLVGVDGAGGSGKSTLARALAEAIGAEVVHVDDFYLPSGLRPAGAAAEEPGAFFDLARLRAEAVAPLAAGREARFHRYDWDADAPAAEETVVAAGRPVVVEGVHALHRSLRGLYTFRIHCEAARETRLRRGLERDGEAARSMWVDVWMPAEDRYLAAHRPQDCADVLISTD